MISHVQGHRQKCARASKRSLELKFRVWVRRVSSLKEMKFTYPARLHSVTRAILPCLDML